MSKDFFVMLTTQKGSFTPMTESESEEIAKFEYEGDATIAASETVLGEQFGYEVFEIGRGC